jgi:hypothetical protein
MATVGTVPGLFDEPEVHGDAVLNQLLAASCIRAAETASQKILSERQTPVADRDAHRFHRVSGTLWSIVIAEV